MSQTAGALPLGTDLAPARPRERAVTPARAEPAVRRRLLHVTATALRIAAVAATVITAGALFALVTAGIDPTATAVAVSLVAALGVFIVLVSLAGAEMLYAVVRLSDRVDMLTSSLCAERPRSLV